MKRLLAFFFLCGLMFSAKAQNKLERKVLELERRRLEAQTKQDTLLLNEILDDDLIYTHSGGIIEDKKTYVHNVGQKVWDYRTIDIKSLTAKQLGDIVILNGKGIFVIFSQGKYLTLNLAFTEVYHKKKGKWQMLLWQSARLADQ